jgi:hypothetical protein
MSPDPTSVDGLSWLHLGRTRPDGIPAVVGDLIPDGFPGYCRVPPMLRWPRPKRRWGEAGDHVLPKLADRLPPDERAAAMPVLEKLTWTGPERRWSEIASLLGVTLSAQTSPADFARRIPAADRDEFWASETFGGLSEEQLEALRVTLQAHTSSSVMYVARWEGIGEASRRADDGHPVELRPGWRYYLFRSDVSELPTYLDYYGHLLWPEDKTWVVNDDVNTRSIYLGGSASLVERLSIHPALDSVPVALTDPAW